MKTIVDAITKVNPIVGGSVPIGRVMPNTPAMVGAGAAAYALGPNTIWPKHAPILRTIFEAVGTGYPSCQLDQFSCVLSSS